MKYKIRNRRTEHIEGHEQRVYDVVGEGNYLLGNVANRAGHKEWDAFPIYDTSRAPHGIGSIRTFPTRAQAAQCVHDFADGGRHKEKSAA